MNAGTGDTFAEYPSFIIFHFLASSIYISLTRRRYYLNRKSAIVMQLVHKV